MPNVEHLDKSEELENLHNHRRNVLLLHLIRLLFWIIIPIGIIFALWLTLSIWGVI
jgi:hypothetical protein